MKRLIILSLAIFITCGSAYAKGTLPGGWFDGKPVNPPVTPPPVTPPPPVQTSVTEQGVKAVFSAETDWYFPKPIADYGKFDLFIGVDGAYKKYTISMAYKDSQVEVRNSETRRTMVVIAPASFRDKKAYISYPSGETVTPPPVTPPVTPPADGAVESKRFAHINHMSWNGQGTTIVFCAGDDVTSVTFHDTAFHFHMKDGLDKGVGREQWTNHYFQKKSETQTAGLFVWTIGGKKYQHYSDGRGDGLADYQKHTGECYHKY